MIPARALPSSARAYFFAAQPSNSNLPFTRRPEPPMRRTLQSFHRCEHGATSIEYAIIAAILAVAVIAGATVFGTAVNSKFQGAADKVAATP
jgi:pilus assembly protein Flp/PilA